MLRLKEVKVVKEDLSVATPCGGDESNYYFFYCDAIDYEQNTPENIAQFGKEHLSGLKNMSTEEIISKHLFFGTEGMYFKAFYNGDTYILFDDIEKLPEDIKEDAYAFCEGYRKRRRRGK